MPRAAAAAAAHRRPLLLVGTLVLAATCLASHALSGLAFAAPLADRSAGSRALAEGARGGGAAAAPAVPPRAAGSLAQGAAVALVAAAVLGARAQRRAGGGRVVTSQPPESYVPRGERAKGQQVLPLARRLQHFFSRRNRQFWDYTVSPRTYFQRAWAGKDVGYAVFFAVMHAGALMAPFHFTWPAFGAFLVGYLITGMFGITLSYHRQLAHRSFTTPRWLEYLFAYCGVLALQSHPINWCSSHRHHHGGCESERDVHSPLDGFWWSHMGWLMDREGTWMRQNKNNASDLAGQWYYRFLAKTYPLHAIVLPIAGLYAYGGLPFLLWGFFFRVCWVWHVTWMVNSVSHVWGFKDWNTDDNAMNNWFVGILAFGEGWHNNHHAFESSCRHGLKWWQVDCTWYVVKLLSFVGLATNLKYPSEGKMRKLSFAKA